MASPRPLSIDECGVCFELMKEPRVLKCDHTFCLKCVQAIEKNKEVPCPFCREKTVIVKGLEVTHLPKLVPKKQARDKKPELVSTIILDVQVTGVAIDEEIQVVYIGRDDIDKPIEMFSYDGRSLGSVNCEKRFGAPRLAMDTKKRLLLAIAGREILTFDRDGTHVGAIRCPEFQMLYDITYDVRQNKYIVLDKQARCIRVVDPETHSVTRTIHPEEEDEMLNDNNVVCVTSDKSGKSSMFVTTDSRTSAVRLYDGDGLQVKGYRNTGSSYGQFTRPKGVCFNADGQIIVSDSGNSRLVCLSPDAAHDHQQWSVLMDTKTHNLAHPRDIDIATGGIMAVVFWTKLDGPFKVALFTTT